MTDLRSESPERGAPGNQQNETEKRPNTVSVPQEGKKINGAADGNGNPPVDPPRLSTPLAAALYYFDHGCFVIPCCTMNAKGKCTFRHTHDKPESVGKVPLLGEGWQLKRLTREEIIQWWTKHPTANVGVLLEPSNLLVIDIDSQAATEEASANGLQPGPQVRAGRGVHHYYLNPKKIIWRTTRQGESRAIDILSKGIVIGYGSTHRTGKPYELLVSWEEWPLEEPPLWAEQILAERQRTGDVSPITLPSELLPVDIDFLPVAAWVKELIHTGQHSDGSGGVVYLDRSEPLWAVEMALVDAGCDDATIGSILLNPAYAISAKPREKGMLWTAGDIARARAKAAHNAKEKEENYKKARELEEQIEKQAIPKKRKARRKDTTQELLDGLPRIVVNNRPLRAISDESLAALIARNDPPTLFMRSGKLTRCLRDEEQRPILDTLTEAALCGYLTRSANFLTRTYTKDDLPKDTQVPPPVVLVRDVYALGTLPFPPLAGLVECPVLRPDGTVVIETGYDPATRLLYEPAAGLLMPTLPASPTQTDARIAAQFILTELLVDFPFCDDADKANMVAALLTPIVRPAIDGIIPLCLLDKPAAGTGASLLSDLVALVSTGESAAKLTAPEGRDDGEWRKKITSILVKGSPVVVVDNIATSLASSALSSVLTTRLWTDRLMGKNEMITVPMRACFIATANNISVRGDLARRCYRVRMDAKMEQPWTRTNFKHDELLKWANAHRGEILASLLTMARAWFVAKPPKVDVAPMGEFKTWARMVGGILAYAGVTGFLGNQDAMYELVDDEAPQWAHFLETLFAYYPDRSFSIADVASSTGALRESFPDSLAWDEGEPTSSRKRLGWAFRQRMNRIFSGFSLQRDERRDATRNAVLWRVVRLSQKESREESREETELKD